MAEDRDNQRKPGKDRDRADEEQRGDPRSSPRSSSPRARLIAFLVREWVAREPVVDLRVFKVRTYSTGVFLMTTLGFVLYGSLVLLPIMLQTLLGYPSLQAGIAMAPRGMDRSSACRWSA